MHARRMLRCVKPPAEQQHRPTVTAASTTAASTTAATRGVIPIAATTSATTWRRRVRVRPCVVLDAQGSCLKGRRARAETSIGGRRRAGAGRSRSIGRVGSWASCVNRLRRLYRHGSRVTRPAVSIWVLWPSRKSETVEMAVLGPTLELDDDLRLSRRLTYVF